MFKEISTNSTFLKVCPFFKDEVRMADTEFISLLYFLTIFDDGLKVYSKKWKNVFIDESYNRLRSEIYSFESYFEDSERIDVDEQNEESEESLDEDKSASASQLFFDKTKSEIIENLSKVFSIYGDYLTGARLERYVIETLYYNIYFRKRVLSRSFLSRHSSLLGKCIYDAIELSKTQSTEDEAEISLWVAFNDRVSDTSRILYRFNKIGEIIDSFISTTKGAK